MYACDPFWTQQNGGICSDPSGNYLRPDGTIVTSDEVARVTKPAMTLGPESLPGGLTTTIGFPWAEEQPGRGPLSPVPGGGADAAYPGGAVTTIGFPFLTTDAGGFDVAAWVSERSGLVLAGIAFVVAVLMLKGRR
jgi:hypothetical protein